MIEAVMERTAAPWLESAPQIAPEPLGIFYGWWRGDTLPSLRRAGNLRIDRVDNRGGENLANVDLTEHEERTARGHELWVAWLGGEPAGWGWVATREARIGQFGLDFAIPPRDRYLWDFVTLPPARGRGIYPLMLQEIITRGDEIDRFWIGHDRANHSSRRGILKGGFKPVGAAHLCQGAGIVLLPLGPAERSHAAARLLGLPLINDLAAVAPDATLETVQGFPQR